MALPVSLDFLLSPAAYAHPAASVQLIETHISWVLLAGPYAYKIKKPVNFGFLDFSTLALRRHCCEEEVRLNRRLAPDIYLAVVPVTGTGMESGGEALEWAVKMRAFPPDATLDREAVITLEQIDAIADRLAAFHGEVGSAPKDSDYGSPEAVMQPVRENLKQIAAMLPSTAGEHGGNLATWSEQEYRRLQPRFAARKASGFVRECHGDLHLGNIAWVDQAPLIFDCIEFNPALRFVDVQSEIAFLFMDLISRGLDALAWRFLNRYLEHTGDYDGLAVFRFYLVYRATVRAKVAALRAAQSPAEDAPDVLRYLNLAKRLSRSGRPALLLMHGYSGSGKTWLSQRVQETLGGIRIRSDVERKRLFALPALADSKSAGDIYSPAASRRTLERLLALTEAVLDQGYIVIVDATFLGRAWRSAFIALADKKALPARLLSLDIAPDTLRRRVSERLARSDDASEADLSVLESQMSHADPLDAKELAIRQSFVEAVDWTAAIRELRDWIDQKQI